MRKKTQTLVIMASALYYIILTLGVSLLPAGFDPPLYLLAAPLLVLVLILTRDLLNRATVPAEEKPWKPPSRRLSQEVRELTRQIEVGVDASPSYFQRTMVERLREVLVEKVALEIGIERGRVRETLANVRLGPGLLRNDRLHRLLYSEVPGRGPARVKMLEEAIALVESWKP